jgi:hypothetical protein
VKKNSICFKNPDPNFEKGFLLLSLCLWIPIWFLLLHASNRWIVSAHSHIALQSRLDICVVQKTVNRKIAIQRIIASNEIVRFTLLGITAIRGLAIISGPLGKLASTLGEATLKKMNHLEGIKQDILLKKLSLEEKNIFCNKTKFSSISAICQISPATQQLLYRSSRSQPDLYSPYLAKSSLFGKIRCFSKTLISEIHLQGDPRLLNSNLREKYAK